MSKTIQLSESTWAGLAALAGVSPETLTPRQASATIDMLIWRDAAQHQPLQASSRKTVDQLMAEYLAAADPESWLAARGKGDLKRLARRLGVVQTETIAGRYYRNDELRDLIFGAPMPAMLYNVVGLVYLRCEPDEAHDPIWDNRIEVAKVYPSMRDALAALRACFNQDEAILPVWLPASGEETP